MRKLNRGIIFIILLVATCGTVTMLMAGDPDVEIIRTDTISYEVVKSSIEITTHSIVVQKDIFIDTGVILKEYTLVNTGLEAKIYSQMYSEDGDLNYYLSDDAGNYCIEKDSLITIGANKEKTLKLIVRPDKAGVTEMILSFSIIDSEGRDYEIFQDQLSVQARERPNIHIVQLAVPEEIICTSDNNKLVMIEYEVSHDLEDISINVCLSINTDPDKVVSVFKVVDGLEIEIPIELGCSDPRNIEIEPKEVAVIRIYIEENDAGQHQATIQWYWIAAPLLL